MSPLLFAMVDMVLHQDLDDVTFYDWGTEDEVAEATHAVGWWRSTW